MKSPGAKMRYAVMAALDLAEHYDADRPVKVRDIAARIGAPPKYLVHILLRLKRAALVNSTRGPKGGYWLLCPPRLISVADVIAAVEGARPKGPAWTSDNAYERELDGLLQETQRRDREFMAGVTLADLTARKNA